MMNLVKLNDYFKIHNGLAKSNLKVSNLKIDANFIPYIRPAKCYENSLDGYVDKDLIQKNKIFSSGTIYISTDGEGSHSYSYVSCFEFVPNSNVIALVPKIELSLVEKLFYANCITSNRFKFSYSRKPKKNRIKDLLIPSKDSIPSFVYNKKIKTISKEALINKKFELNTKNWGKFLLSDFFNISGTKTTTIKNLQKSGDGDYPYITTKATNNGCAGFYSIYTEKGNVITVDSAVLGYASYQHNNFSASDHVEKLTPKFELNKYIALFFTVILNREQYRFNYGRKASQERLKNLFISLPKTAGNKPDWQFMENYIKSLPYSKNLEN